VAWFLSTSANATNNQCLGAFGNDHAACTTATASGQVGLDAVIVPSGGATISKLQVQLDTNAAGSGNKVTVLDNGSATALTCTVASGTSTCTDSTDSVSITAGHYLQVKITNNAGAADRKYQVSFRF